MKPILLILGIAISFVALLIMASTMSFSREYHTHEGAVGQFYQSWTMPDNRNVSCCHDQDCSLAEARFENGHWVARKMGDLGAFTPIPQSKIEQDRDSPDGLNHICARPDGFGSLTVFCFLPAGGG